MRETCLDCARKHIGQAVVLIDEAMMGYPMHIWLAVGHLAEASSELIKDYPDLANEIREVRINLMEGGDPDLMPLLEKITNTELVEASLEEENEIRPQG